MGLEILSFFCNFFEICLKFMQSLDVKTKRNEGHSIPLSRLQTAVWDTELKKNHRLLFPAFEAS